MTIRGGDDLLKSFHAALAAWNASKSTERLWAKDPSLWPGDAHKWLGWLDAVAITDAQLDALTAKLNAAVPAQITDALLLGMGGSSLGAEVVARVLPRGASGRVLRILDSTHPAAVRDAFAKTKWANTLTVVASKSGSTLEPDILLAAAIDVACAKLGLEATKQVLAITDPGSRLEQQAASLRFAGVVHGEPSIGGRFSVLSVFGLVPAFLHGVDLRAFVASARAMADRCKSPGDDNPGAALGTFMAEMAKQGRDKCTLVLPASLAPMGAWIEQLVAESTGKHGKVILPIDGEPLASPPTYSRDRAFVHVRIAGERDANATAVDTIAAAGHPVFTIDARSATDLAGEFFRWEFATAVAGSQLGVNPFDQPDVESAKVATRAITDEYERGAKAGHAPPMQTTSDSRDDVRALLASIKSGDYFGVLAFLPMTADVVASLETTRTRVRDAKHAATTLGFGPRFLHSTGQAFKGGPNSGVFLQLTWTAPTDLPVPGRQLTFGTVVAAQAAGDLQVLRERGRRCAHIHLAGNLQAALKELDATIAGAL